MLRANRPARVSACEPWPHGSIGSLTCHSGQGWVKHACDGARVPRGGSNPVHSSSPAHPNGLRSLFSEPGPHAKTVCKPALCWGHCWQPDKRRCKKKEREGTHAHGAAPPPARADALDQAPGRATRAATAAPPAAAAAAAAVVGPLTADLAAAAAAAARTRCPRPQHAIMARFRAARLRRGVRIRVGLVTRD